MGSTEENTKALVGYLEEHGVDTKGVHVMSGFRTPQYNATGGETGGRCLQ